MKFGLHEEPGWVGFFTRQQAKGAIPNGTTIRKTNSEDGDGMPDGAYGVVLGSITASDLGPPPAGVRPATFLYWVEWRRRPRHAVYIVDWKLRRTPDA